MPRNPLKLNYRPTPLRSKDNVLINECRDSWSETPLTLVVKNKAEFNALGRLYDWQWIRQERRSMSLASLCCQQWTIERLLKPGFVTQKGQYITLTAQGKRAYEVTYWYLDNQACELREARQLKRQRQRERATGWRDPYSKVRQYNNLD